MNQARILCVDDEPGVLRALKWVFEKDYDVTIAASSQEALEIIQQKDFEVVISDQRMPGIMGVELLEKMRLIKPKTIRILLTGYSDMGAMLDSINKGEIFRFIKKPWDIQELKRVVAEAVNIARGLSENEAEVYARVQQEPQILIMDDDPAVISLIQSVVGNPERTLVAINIAEAIAALDQSDQIGVIVSDLYLNGLDVSRLLKVVKAKAPEITSVVLSSRSDAEDVINLINEGQVYRFTFKPAKKGALKMSIQSALDKHISLLNDPQSVQQYRVERLKKEEIESLLQDAEEQSRESFPHAGVLDKGIFQRFSNGLCQLLGR